MPKTACLMVLTGMVIIYSCSPSSHLTDSNGPPAGPDTSWSRTFSGADMDFHCALARTSDGGFILAGQNIFYTIWMAKLSPTGDVEWTATPISEWQSGANDIHQLPSGGYVITGGIGGSGGSYDMLLLKTDALGIPRCLQNFGGLDFDVGYDVERTPEGGFLIAGTTENYGMGNRDAWIVKTDSVGHQLWNLPFGQTEDDAATRLKVTSDSGFVAAGHVNGTGTLNDDSFWMMKTGSSGLVQWFRSYCPGPELECWGLVQTTDGGFLLGGTYGFQIGVPGGNAHLKLIKTDSLGNQEWIQAYSSGTQMIGGDLEACQDGGYLVTGYALNGQNGNDLFLMKTNGLGAIQWQRFLGGSGDERGCSVVELPDGSCAVSGFTTPIGGAANFWVMRMENY